MLSVLSTIAPMFVLLGLGMIAGFAPRFRSAQAGLNAFVFTFALPAFLFVAVTNAPIRDGVPLAFVGISLGATALVYALVHLGAFLVRGRGSAGRAGLAPGPLAVASTYGNVGYLGVPIVLSVAGPGAALGAALGQLLHNLLFMVGYPLLKSIRGGTARGGREGERGVWRLLWRLAKGSLLLNPVVLAVVAGAAVNLLDIVVPTVLAASFEMLGGAAVPAAMFAVGLTIKPALAGMRSGAVSVAGVAVASVVKLVALPLLTILAVALFGGGLAPQWVASAVIMAAMPVSSTASVIVFEYDGDVRLVGAATLVTSVAALVTIPLVLSVAG
ncbi:AEC family transporter [Leucobacter aridicollis]|uniref:AEC family transporter n=1 Tax=Leucobacter aridicollis TaxID=283878 RepID=UPI0021039EA1|nr:AEC family transporter [Leucobacter aridicollis]UTX54035.1 AEC family transporter [Leucobacter aridicollis]